MQGTGSLVSSLAESERMLQNSSVTWKQLVGAAKIWHHLESPKRAEHYLRQALTQAPEEAEIWSLLGTCLLDQRRLAEALAATRAAIVRQPNLIAAQVEFARCQHYRTHEVQLAIQTNNWHLFNESRQELLALHKQYLISHKILIVEPFSALGFLLSGKDLLRTAKTQAVEFLHQQGLKQLSRPKPEPWIDRRLRIGYLSADFRDNAAGHLLHKMFAFHDQERFSITAYTIGPNDGSEFRRQIEGDVERFIDLQYMDDATAAKTIAKDRIDLLVDLMGFAGNHRAGILARRPAPIQICWLGYCMSTGAPWIDEYYADEFIVPQEQRQHFSEEICYFPDCYQIYSPLDLHGVEVKREACDLPENAFVYACFNSVEKVDSEILDCWCEILHARQDAVLWLLATNEQQRKQYINRFSRRNIKENQLVFASMWPKRKHLARLKHVDLFLDTTICNAHTTASDALFMGIPVLTYPGKLMAQRVAGSVCMAAGLPDLVVDSLAEYSRVAIALGGNQQTVHRMKQKLVSAHHQAPLFNLPLFVSHLEKMFEDSFHRWDKQ